MKQNWYVGRKLSKNDGVILAALADATTALTRTDVTRAVSNLRAPYDENQGAWDAATRALYRLVGFGYVSMTRVSNRWRITATERGMAAHKAGRYV